MRRCGLNQSANNFIALFAGKKGDFRIAQNFGGELVAIMPRNVRQIRDDEVEFPLDLLEQVAFEKLNASDPKPDGIFVRQQQGVIRNIGSDHFRLGNFFRQRQCNYPRTSAEIDDFRFSIHDSRFNQSDKFFRFRPRNERAYVAEKDVSAKFDRAEQMLERLVLPAPADKLAERRQFGLGQIALELEINIEPFPPERMRQQMFGVQARILNPAFFEVGGGGLKNVEHRHTLRAPNAVRVTTKKGARRVSITRSARCLSIALSNRQLAVLKSFPRARLP